MASVNEISKTIIQISGAHDLWQVWCDFILMSATAIANATDKRHPVWSQREEAYMKTVQRYKKSELALFQQAFRQTVDALEKEPADVLGQTYMQLELGNKWRGQFFTPDSVCKMMAHVTLHNATDQLRAQGFITYNEPAIGGGAMVIGAYSALLEAGFNPQAVLHVTGVDIDIKAVHMSYIQLSLLGIPAVIVHGNPLKLEEWSHWFTPFHILHGWSYKLERPRPNEPWLQRDLFSGASAA